MGITLRISVNALKMTAMISIVERLIGEYQKELLIAISEIKIHNLYNMQ